MDDLIYRNKLLEVMNEYMQTDLDDFGRKDVITAILRQGCKKTIAIVEAAPTVDAEPVRHGRWVTPVPGDGDPYCSECKMYAELGVGYYPILSRRCPNCGAKMDMHKKNRPSIGG